MNHRRITMILPQQFKYLGLRNTISSPRNYLTVAINPILRTTFSSESQDILTL